MGRKRRKSPKRKQPAKKKAVKKTVKTKAAPAPSTDNVDASTQTNNQTQAEVRPVDHYTDPAYPIPTSEEQTTDAKSDFSDDQPLDLTRPEGMPRVEVREVSEGIDTKGLLKLESMVGATSGSVSEMEPLDMPVMPEEGNDGIVVVDPLIDKVSDFLEPVPGTKIGDSSSKRNPTMTGLGQLSKPENILKQNTEREPLAPHIQEHIKPMHNTSEHKIMPMPYTEDDQLNVEPIGVQPGLGFQRMKTPSSTDITTLPEDTVRALTGEDPADKPDAFDNDEITDVRPVPQELLDASREPETQTTNKEDTSSTMTGYMMTDAEKANLNPDYLTPDPLAGEHSAEDAIVTDEELAQEQSELEQAADTAREFPSMNQEAAEAEKARRLLEEDPETAQEPVVLPADREVSDFLDLSDQDTPKPRPILEFKDPDPINAHIEDQLNGNGTQHYITPVPGTLKAVDVATAATTIMPTVSKGDDEPADAYAGTISPDGSVTREDVAAAIFGGDTDKSPLIEDPGDGDATPRDEVYATADLEAAMADEFIRASAIHDPASVPPETSVPEKRDDTPANAPENSESAAGLVGALIKDSSSDKSSAPDFKSEPTIPGKASAGALKPVDTAPDDSDYKPEERQTSVAGAFIAKAAKPEPAKPAPLNPSRIRRKQLPKTRVYEGERPKPAAQPASRYRSRAEEIRSMHESKSRSDRSLESTVSKETDKDTIKVDGPNKPKRRGWVKWAMGAAIAACIGVGAYFSYNTYSNNQNSQKPMVSQYAKKGLIKTVSKYSNAGTKLASKEKISKPKPAPVKPTLETVVDAGVPAPKVSQPDASAAVASRPASKPDAAVAVPPANKYNQPDANAPVASSPDASASAPSVNVSQPDAGTPDASTSVTKPTKPKLKKVKPKPQSIDGYCETQIPFSFDSTNYKSKDTKQHLEDYVKTVAAAGHKTIYVNGLAGPVSYKGWLHKTFYNLKLSTRRAKKAFKDLQKLGKKYGVRIVDKGGHGEIEVDYHPDAQERKDIEKVLKKKRKELGKDFAAYMQDYAEAPARLAVLTTSRTRGTIDLDGKEDLKPYGTACKAPAPTPTQSGEIDTPEMPSTAPSQPTTVAKTPIKDSVIVEMIADYSGIPNVESSGTLESSVEVAPDYQNEAGNDSSERSVEFDQAFFAEARKHYGKSGKTISRKADVAKPAPKPRQAVIVDAGYSADTKELARVNAAFDELIAETEAENSKPKEPAQAVEYTIENLPNLSIHNKPVETDEEFYQEIEYDDGSLQENMDPIEFALYKIEHPDKNYKLHEDDDVWSALDDTGLVDVDRIYDNMSTKLASETSVKATKYHFGNRESTNEAMTDLRTTMKDTHQARVDKRINDIMYEAIAEAQAEKEAARQDYENEVMAAIDAAIPLEPRDPEPAYQAKGNDLSDAIDNYLEKSA